MHAFTQDEAKHLKKAYRNAVKNGLQDFQCLGHTFNTGYACTVLQRLAAAGLIHFKG